MKNEKYLDEITSKHMKNMGLDEPSADFTLKVMQSIALAPQHQIAQKQKYWLLLFIPVLMGIGWYMIPSFNLSGYGHQLLFSVRDNIQPLVSSFSDFFSSLKNISPVIIISSLAVLLLLFIEELATRIKHTS
jgi:hypothetical protein